MPAFSSARGFRNNEMLQAEKVVAFSGAAGNGATGNVALFAVTGDVILTVFATCSESLVSAGGGTLSLGTAAFPTQIIGNTTATLITAGRAWADTGPADIETVPSTKMIAAGADIVTAVGTAAVTDGTLTFYALWRPLSVGSTVVAT